MSAVRASARAAGSALSIPLASVFIGVGLTAHANSKGLSEALAVANYTDRDTFDRQRLAAQVDIDRREVRVLGFELHRMAASPQALDGNLVAEPRHDNLPAARFLRLVHGEEVAFQDAGVAHRHAAHAQQVIGPRREKIGVDLVAPLQVLFGKHGRTSGYASDDGELEQLAGALAAAHANAARCTRGNFNGAFFLQRAQMLLGGVHRAKTHLL